MKLRTTRQADADKKNSEKFIFEKGNYLPFLKWNDEFEKRKVFISNMIRFRSAMKPNFLVMKNHISLRNKN